MQQPITIYSAVEGIADEAAVRKLIAHVGANPGTTYGKCGKNFLREKIAAYTNAARRAPWIVLIDLDQDAPCAPPLREAWIPDPAQHLCFRVAVRELEAWLLADTKGIASFMGVAQSKVPRSPEELDDPKLTMINLARRSRRSNIRADMLPREGSGRLIGPAYTSRLVEFIATVWQPAEAALRADSLRRAISGLTALTVAVT
jgi:hypothetical protein